MVFAHIHRYRSHNLARYMRTFSVTYNQQSYKLLKSFLTMDPKLRISCPQALVHLYFREMPNPTDNAFALISTLPFPKRPYLTNQNDTQTVQ